jgi:hypothetical protein
MNQDELNVSDTDLTVEFKLQPISIHISSNTTGEEIGKFYEKDGLLTFEGKVDQAGREFVDHVCRIFNRSMTDDK